MLQIGIVNFINTAPFYEPWKELGTPRGWKVVEGVPSHLNRLLTQGAIHAGLVSSYTYGEKPEDLVILKDISISAAGPVKSVLFLSPVPLEEIRDGIRVVVTPKSATSVMLLRIILELFYGLRYHQDFLFTQGDLAMALAENAPYLAIGDEALALSIRRLQRIRRLHRLQKIHRLRRLHRLQKIHRLRRLHRLQKIRRLRRLHRLHEVFGYTYDLGEIWIRETGLPFVFAVLAASREAWKSHPEEFDTLYHHIRQCLEKGLKRLEEISIRVAPRIPMEPGPCLDYLKGIDYDLSPEKLQGLSMFYEYLCRLKIIGAVPDLKLIP